MAFFLYASLHPSSPGLRWALSCDTSVELCRILAATLVSFSRFPGWALGWQLEKYWMFFFDTLQLTQAIQACDCPFCAMY
jgi:hypothetical protein